MVENSPLNFRMQQGRLEAHPVYTSVRSVQQLRTFMEHHAVCVLDFMSLVKRLQWELTCTRVPWTPSAHPELARLLNEIVLDEESDDAFGPQPSSHYEWYLAAMDQMGADTNAIRRLESRLRRGVPPQDALTGSGLPEASEEFARTTFELCEGPLHVVAAAFFHGREDVIPRMFLPLAKELQRTGISCSLLIDYLQRHIEMDGESHGPHAARLFAALLEDQPESQAEARAAAQRALHARELLWDAIARACNAGSPQACLLPSQGA